MSFISLRSIISSADRVPRAREHIAHIVQPLIDGIRMFTKTSVTILIGSPPDAMDNNYFVKVLNAGKTLNGKDFHDWDREGFKANVLHHFVCFLSQTSGANFLFLFSACHLSFF